MVIIWVVSGLLLICSIVLLSGRGAWMIAGYNTAGKEVKSRYDQKKLTKAVGTALLVFAVATIPLALVHSVAYIIIYMVFMILSVVALLIYLNTKCFAAGAELHQKAAVSGVKTNKAVFITIILFALAVIVGSIIMLSLGGEPPVYALSSDQSSFTIDSMYGLTIDTSAIQSLELKTALPDNLKRTNGYGGAGSVLKGYCSSSIGDVLVFIDTSRSAFLYITTPTQVIILTGESDEQTTQLYDMLDEIVKKPGAT